MAAAALFLASFLGGALQTVTGFGAGIIVMLALENYYNMLVAPALCAAILIGATVILSWKYRKFINLKKIILPTIAYLLCSLWAIYIANMLDTTFLSKCLGLFLVGMSAYFLFFQNHVSLRPTPVAAIVCGGISGLCAGLVGIGGPAMGLYMIMIADNHREYIGNIQFSFFIVNIAFVWAKVKQGLFTIDLLPITLIALCGLCLGILLGLYALKNVKKDMVKKAVYIFTGVSGVITFLQNL